MIELTDIAYVRSGVADLDKAVGVRHRDRGPGTGGVPGAASAPDPAGPRVAHAAGRLAAITAWPWSQGPSGVIASGFAVADEDALAAAETELERSGLRSAAAAPGEARQRRVRAFIGFDDPFGNRIELVSQQETITRPVAFARPAGITEFGHLCLDAPDVHEAYRFWSTRFNARVSDWIGDAACLLRIDPVHHKLAVFRGDGPGLCHMNFQVATIDDVFRNWHFLTQPRRGDRDGAGPSPPVDGDLPVLPRPGGIHLRVLLRRAADRGRRGVAAAHLRSGRARLDRHVARPGRGARSPSRSCGDYRR